MTHPNAARRHHRAILLLACALTTKIPAISAFAQQKSPQKNLVNVANSAIEHWPSGHIAAPNTPVLWGFEPGIVLAGFNAAWTSTHDPHYLDYIRQSVDQFVSPDGTIRTYDLQAYSLNNILIGRQLLLLYRTTGNEKYRKAADTLHQQLLHQPLTASGGYWHAQATPNLMLLDDTFMFAPFLAEYAVTFHQPKDLVVIATQFQLLAAHTLDPKTGLLYHGWDESRTRPWVNKSTGDSATLWSRGMGWYLMALVDTLPYYPQNDPHRAELLTILQHTAAAIIRAQDTQSNLWYQVLDQPHLPGNYIESSSSLMLIYALAKGTRLGYLPHTYAASTSRAWRSIQTRFLQQSPTGAVSITGTVTHVSLGAVPENDGSYNYYLHAPIVSDDPKGIGAFLLAASEMEFARNTGHSSQNKFTH